MPTSGWGPRKVWRRRRRDDRREATCTLERERRVTGVLGTSRGPAPGHHATECGQRAAADVVGRCLTTTRANQRWFADLMNVATWRRHCLRGIRDRRLRAAASSAGAWGAVPRTDFVPDALDQAIIYDRCGGEVTDLAHHNDRGPETCDAVRGPALRRRL